MRSLIFAGCAALAVFMLPHDALSQPSISIMNIQGRGHTSPLAGDSVVTSGVVTAVAPDGCFVQDPDGDGDPATSDGVFVYTGTRPDVFPGDVLRVRGIVREYRSGDAADNLTVTELGAPIIERIGSAAPLPAPVRLGGGGRVPPASVIDDDNFADYDPDSDGVDFYESVEGMRVLVPGATAVSVTGRYGDVWVVGEGGRFATGMNAQGGITIGRDDLNPERIRLDDRLLSGGLPAVAVGARIGDVTGIVDYRFGNFAVMPSSLPEAGPASQRREATALHAGATALTVASFNVANLDGRDRDRVAALAGIVAVHLGAPDVVVLEEVQDDSGTSDDGTVTAANAYAAMVDAVVGAGGPRYDFRDIAPEDGRDGGAPGANIRVGVLFRPDRVEFVDRGLPAATAATTVVTTDAGPVLSISPGRLEPTAAAWESSRKPLAAELRFGTTPFFLVACHFASRSGSGPLFGAVQPPVVARAAKRIDQAGIVRRFVEDLLAVDGDARVIVLGDFNDFQFSRTMTTLAGPLFNLTELLPSAERYTYNFEGNSQALDHILVSPALASNARVDVVHTCVDFLDAASDHDPVLAQLSFAAPPPTTLPTAPLTVRPNPFTTTTTVTFAGTARDPGDADVYDVRGRHVRSLVLRAVDDHHCEGVWDGRNQRGTVVPAGVYIVCIRQGRRSVVAKLVRLR